MCFEYGFEFRWVAVSGSGRSCEKLDQLAAKVLEKLMIILRINKAANAG